ncbi:Trappc4 protein [Fusarium oxysporum Fo47]|uniref:Trappc4 protein n=1 Tax=Fusarium oxysporum Fo47 TaxID=660027 RepID=UPI00286980FF|nr:Trappc4 protein [Fusarium oxysporum Fo47]QKD57263.2 Trappc4 protein [Fusarium oxysporum Fo47]
MAPGSPSTRRPRTKRVSAQHTRERVRNNQRRHRARRKDYIATLEEKLGEAEQTISTLRDQIEALQATLTRYRHYQNDQNRANSFLSSSVAADTEDFGAWKLPAPASRKSLVSNDLPGPHLKASYESITKLPLAVGSASTFSPRAAPELTFTAVSYQAVAETGSLLPETVIPDQVLTSTTSCCFSDPSSGAQSTVNTINRMPPLPCQEIPLLMPAYVLESAIEANSYRESTMLCSEAYILIAQQNFKGISQRDVATWLWDGFHSSLPQGEGCRVNTDLLFSLLAFISDT